METRDEPYCIRREPDGSLILCFVAEPAGRRGTNFEIMLSDGTPAQGRWRRIEKDTESVAPNELSTDEKKTVEKLLEQDRKRYAGVEPEYRHVWGQTSKHREMMQKRL